MTKKEKELLLKDLCARLPYGFTVHRYSDNCNITFGANKIDDFAHFLEYSEGEKFKPYLRPMSSMTEKESTEYANCGNIIAQSVEGGYLIPNPKDIDWLNKKMFDYRGLIPMGLALEAPEDMYKN